MHEEKVRRLYAVLNSDNPRAAVDSFRDDGEWQWPRGGPDAGVYRGREEIARAAEQWDDSWADFEMEPEEIIERGDEVFVMCRYRGTGRGSGVPIDTHVAHVWEFDGDQVARLRMFGQAERARQRFLDNL
ncbi:MAG TPA: nuclear transport factor 2 family protein [Thermoleophilaceae bacterium]